MEAQETLTDGTPTGSGNVIRMPATWNRSYRELYRCLKLLRENRPRQYRHVYCRYVDPTAKSMETTFHRGKPRLPRNHELVAGAAISGQKTSRVRVRSWPDWVEKRQYDAGVVYLSEKFRGEPFMPKEFQETT